MSISIDTYCLQCLLRRNIALAQTLGTEEQAMAFAKEIMKLCINAPEGVSSPWFGPKIADLLHDMYGLDYDRFRQEKLDSNRFVLERLPAIREKVTNAKDPVFAGLQFAILGNYLDFSALQGQVSFEKLEEMLDKALEMELDDQVYACLCRDLRRGGKLVYLTDNAGEIGFDRVLAEAIAAAYPEISVTFCVRGAIAQNDATREDAAAVGIPFPVIDNGNRRCAVGRGRDSRQGHGQRGDDAGLRVQCVLCVSGKMPALRHPLRQAHVHPHAGEGTGVKNSSAAGGNRGIFAVRNGAGWAGGSILCSS